MNGSVAVAKMHGARNDFIVLDSRTTAPLDTIAFARRWCDRHTGVGGDGLLVIEHSERAAARMRVINADGSVAEMCGNGIRCVARYLDDAGCGDALAIETDAGIIETRVIAREPEYLVRVNMGVPKIVPRALPIPGAAFVDMGNPHVVAVCGEGDLFDVAQIGASFQDEHVFPGGANVHQVVVEGPRSLRVRHYERGAGLTMACGTGAVASAAVALRSGLVQSPVDVFVPGGVLRVEWDGAGAAYLTGPAVHVFDTVL